ncbi:MAG: hypothetical protein ABJ215_00645 [Alphaproteobacteria bacterium]
MRFALNTVVWGHTYVDLLVNHSLPTLFSRGNFLENSWTEHFVYQLMTTREDFAEISQAATYQRLERLLEVDVMFIDDIQVDTSVDIHKYNRVSIAQTAGMKRAAETCDGIFFLYPDFIYSTGSLRTVAEKLADGYRAVLCPIPYISQEAVCGGLFRAHGMEVGTAQGKEISIEPRQLVELDILYPHPVNRGYETDSGVYAEWPALFVWPIIGQGQIIHSFHLHPTGLLLEKDNPEFFRHFEISLDDEFISRVFTIGDKLAFINDSDDLAMCSTRSVEDPPHPMEGSRLNLARAALWAEESSSLILRYFTRQQFYWHYRDMTSSEWEEKSVEARRFMKNLRKRLTIPDSLLAIEDPDAYKARQRRSGYFMHRNTGL